MKEAMANIIKLENYNKNHHRNKDLSYEVISEPWNLFFIINGCCFHLLIGVFMKLYHMHRSFSRASLRTSSAYDGIVILLFAIVKH